MLHRRPERPATPHEAFAGLRALLMDLHRLDGQLAAAKALDLPHAWELVTLFDRTVDQALGARDRAGGVRRHARVRARAAQRQGDAVKEPYRVSVLPNLGYSIYCVVEAATGKVMARYDRRDIAQAAATRRNRQVNRKRRPCLACRQPFMSEGPHNRLCTACRRCDMGPLDTPYAVGRR